MPGAQECGSCARHHAQRVQPRGARLPQHAQMRPHSDCPCARYHERTCLRGNSRELDQAPSRAVVQPASFHGANANGNHPSVASPIETANGLVATPPVCEQALARPELAMPENGSTTTPATELPVSHPSAVAEPVGEPEASLTSAGAAPAEASPVDEAETPTDATALRSSISCRRVDRGLRDRSFVE